MNKQQSIDFLRSLSGIKGYKLRTELEMSSALKDQLRISDELSILLPQKYQDVNTKYNLQWLIAREADISPELTSYSAYNGGKYGFSHLFEGFLIVDDIISEHLHYADGEETLFKWGLLKIGRTPWQGGIYLGVEEHNQEQIYWVMLDRLPDDFNPNMIREEDSDGFKLVADDIFEFIEGLHSYFPEEDGETILY